MTDPDPLDAPVDLAKMRSTGVTYRQLDYWVRAGWLLPRDEADDGRLRKIGTGNHRRWTLREYLTVDIMVRLTAAGIGLPLAAAVAREAVEDDRREVTVNGVTIGWKAPEDATEPVLTTEEQP